MPLGREVGLGSGDIVLDGDPTPPSKKMAQLRTPTFCAKTAEPVEMLFGLWAQMGPGNPILDNLDWVEIRRGNGRF